MKAYKVKNDFATFMYAEHTYLSDPLLQLLTENT